MEEDYSKLEGKIISFDIGIDPDSGKRIIRDNVKVVGCDPDIGITLQDADTGEYILCMHCPMSPLLKDEKTLAGLSKHRRALFQTIVAMIKTGTVCANTIVDMNGGFHSGGDPTAGDCSFVQ